MAVQAHPPSNGFFLNRNGQEGNDSSVQPQTPHSPFISPGIQIRMRDTVNETEITASPMNPPPQLHTLHRRRQSPADRDGQLQQCSNREQLFSSLAGYLPGEMRRQTEELDGFVQNQGEQLRVALAENRDRQYHQLMCAAETLLARKLREKEADMEKARRCHRELEARAAQLAADAREWKARALAREAELGSLQARLQRAIAVAGNREVTPAEHGVATTKEAGDAESVYIDPDRVEIMGPGCRICRKNSATVVVLPCRHLSLCTECNGAAVRACPLCLGTKNSTVEAFFA